MMKKALFASEKGRRLGFSLLIGLGVLVVQSTAAYWCGSVCTEGLECLSCFSFFLPSVVIVLADQSWSVAGFVFGEEYSAHFLFGTALLLNLFLYTLIAYYGSAVYRKLREKMQAGGDAE